EAVEILGAVCEQISIFFEKAQASERLASLFQVSMMSMFSQGSVEHIKKILDELVRVMGVQRAFVFLDKFPIPELQKGVGRNSKGEDVSDLDAFSTSVIDECKAERKPVIKNSLDDASIDKSKSMVLNRLQA